MSQPTMTMSCRVKAADAILDMAGIEAVFVVTKKMSGFCLPFQLREAAARSMFNPDHGSLGWEVVIQPGGSQVYDQSIVEVSSAHEPDFRKIKEE